METLIKILKEQGQIPSDAICTPLPCGKSGARIWSVGRDMVLKYARRSDCLAPAWEGLCRERDFYVHYSQQNLPFLPQLYAHGGSELEHWLLLQQGRPLTSGDYTEELAMSIMDALASLHSMHQPSLRRAAHFTFTDKEIQYSLGRWLKLGKALPDVPENTFEDMSECLNLAAGYPNPLPEVPVHGDFHLDNVLLSPEGKVLLIDWQAADMGHISRDLSLFFTYSEVMGIPLDEWKLIEHYCRCYHEKTGTRLSMEDLSLGVSLDSFMLCYRWGHLVLSEADKQPLSRVYYRMRDSYFAIRGLWM